MLITDKLRSYAAAKREIMPGVEHRQHKGVDSRAENSHQPTRRRERFMKRFKSSQQVQRFLSILDQIAKRFHPPPRPSYRHQVGSARSQAFTTWAQRHRCGDGSIVAPVDGPDSTRCAFRYSIDKVDGTSVPQLA